MKKILVTGAFGLVGTELVLALQKKYGKENIIAVAHSKLPEKFDGILEQANVTQEEEITKLVKKYDVGTIYHLAGILSVGSEKNPAVAWEVNLNGLRNVLNIAKDEKIKVFWPSSIAAFGLLIWSPQLFTELLKSRENCCVSIISIDTEWMPEASAIRVLMDGGPIRATEQRNMRFIFFMPQFAKGNMYVL